MNPIRWIMLRLRAIIGRRALESDMQEEMRLHLERDTLRLLSRGLSPAEARAAARRAFGNVPMIQEQARDARGARWVEALIADLRFALRYFARKPMTAVTIVVVLGLGIGANSAIFTVLHAVLARPAPAVPKDDSHARIYGLETARGGHSELRDFSYAELAQLAERRETFVAVAGWTAHDVVLALVDSSGSNDVGAEFVTPNFFTTLGVPLVAGPGFAPHAPTAPHATAVISFDLAEQLYESRQKAIGQRLFANDVALRVVGVAPPRFQGAIPNSRRPDIWMPLSMRSEVARTTPKWLADSARLGVFARLAPNVKREDATAIARHVAAQMAPDTLARVGAARSAAVTELRSPPPTDEIEREDADMIIAISLIGLLVLAVACTNVSALLVAAAVGRRQEIAVRLSQGASRGRLIRQLLTESSLLAIAGAALGILLYWWVTRFVSITTVDITPDMTSLTLTLVFALGTGLIFGLSPALHATRRGVAGVLRTVGSAATKRSRMQQAFVVAQIVFSQPLLVLLAVILSTTIHPRQRLPAAVGDRVISTRFRQASPGDSSELREVADSLMRSLATVPGVAGIVPNAGAIDFQNVQVAQTTSGTESVAGDAARLLLTGVAPGYFELLGAQILLGRDVALGDSIGSDYAVVIGSEAARAFWGVTNPVGRRLVSVENRNGKTDSLSFMIVGVVDATHPALASHNRKLYTAHGKQWSTYALLLRTHTSAEAAMPELHKIIRSQAPSLAVSRMETLAGQHERDRRESIQAIAASCAAAALALLLASIGLYGVVSLAVGQRTREIGIRIAVGALPRRVAWMFFSSGVRLSAIALLIGLPVSLVALKLALSQGVLIAPKANIWLIGSGIAAVMMLVASAASWWPARRAVRVDPAVTLRVE